MVKTKNGTTCLALYLGTVCKYGEYYKCDTKNGTIPILQKKKTCVHFGRDFFIWIQSRYDGYDVSATLVLIMYLEGLQGRMCPMYMGDFTRGGE